MFILFVLDWTHQETVNLVGPEGAEYGFAGLGIVVAHQRDGRPADAAAERPGPVGALGPFLGDLSVLAPCREEDGLPARTCDLDADDVARCLPFPNALFDELLHLVFRREPPAVAPERGGHVILGPGDALPDVDGALPAARCENPIP